MSNYNGRHGPNVSQYLRDLNTISPQDTTTEENFNMEDDLALFTNTQFFDFDSGQNTDFQAQPTKQAAARQSRAAPVSQDANAPSVMGEMPNLDFMSGDFNFPEFNAYAAPPMNSFGDNAQNFQHLQSSQGSAPASQQPPFHPNGAQPTEEPKGEPMVATPANRPVNFEDVSRHAAEEDKRRRNTAASARFRIKKKQREQALEQSAKEMSDKVSALESKVSQLETENKWLKNLLVEKNEGNEDITALWKEFTKQASEKPKPATSKAAKAE